MTLKRYPYRQKKWVGPACALFFGATAWVFWLKTRNTERGLVINRVIELSPGEAQFLYWVLLVISLTFVLLGGFIFAASFKQMRYITLTEEAICLPKNGFSKEDVHIPFSSIQALQLQEIQGQVFLNITHSGAKVSIVQSMLTSKAEFSELSKAISAGAQQCCES
jgi:hypothetical protein